MKRAKVGAQSGDVSMFESKPPESSADTLLEERVRTARGLIATHDRRRRPFDLTTLKKWLRLNRSVFKTEKVDVRATGEGIALLPALLDFAREEGIRLSLRTPCDAPAGDLAALTRAGLLDVFLCPPTDDWRQIDPWLAACADAGLPTRIEIHPPIQYPGGIQALAEHLKSAASVNVALYDFFAPPPACRTPEEGHAWIGQANELVRALDGFGIEANLLHVPFCLADEPNWPHTTNYMQFFLDHQHYDRPAYQFAMQVHKRGPRRLDKAIENLLSRRTSIHSMIDNALFPWLINHPLLYIRVWMLHKLTRHLNLLRKARPLPETLGEWEDEVARLQGELRKSLGPVCVACRFQRICDHAGGFFKSQMPGVAIHAVPGAPILSPLYSAAQRPRYYDPMDEARRRLPEHVKALAEAARRITLREAPTRELLADDYEIEKHFTHHMPGAVRWLSMGNVELQSTVLAKLEPPFTMALTFGGGIASHIGFSFGRHARIVCPMLDQSHRLILHVDEAGHYALLRDSVLVRPTEFEGERRLPPRLAGCVEPRISIQNIDGMILTQTLLLWEGQKKPAVHAPGIKYSVIIVSTRYSRRLQAALMALAHQQGIAPESIEAVIGYVPGIDNSDDLIDSLRYTHPHLRIVRSPFSEDYTRAKGFMINECVQASSGEWIVLLDADIILPPDFFAQLERVEAGAHFVAPDGRKMLSPETTARILLGEIRPWEDYPALVTSEGEYRFREAGRTPIGFCQCIRRDILKKNPYHELDHFESSDWLFGWEVVHRFGKETRLEGTVVLHLDHGGSQWYGTAKHM